MTDIDVVDEETLSADPAVVFKALVDEAAGRSHWWMPVVEFIPKSGDGRVGTTYEGHIHKQPPIHFTEQIVERVENQLLRTRFIAGGFIGEGLWTLEPVDSGTKLRFRMHVRPNTMQLRLASALVDLKKEQARVVHEGFEGLRRYLNASPATA